MNITPEDIETFTASAAASVIKNDRELYDPYFVAFEDYAIEKGLTYTLLSAARCIGATTSAETSRPAHDSYFITTSSNAPEDDARNVANIILGIRSIANMPKRVTIRKDATGCTILVNGRGCFMISPVMKYRGTSVDEIIGREKGRGLWTGKEVACQNIFGILSYLLSQSYDPLRSIDEGVAREYVGLLMRKVAEGRDRRGGNDEDAPIPRDDAGGIIIGGRGKKKKDRGDHRGDHRGEHRGKTSQSSVASIISASAENIYVVGNKKGTLPIYLYDGDFDAFRERVTKATSGRVAAYSLHDYDDFALTKYTIHDADDRPACIFYNTLGHQMVPVTRKAEKESPGLVASVYTLRGIILEVQMLHLMSQLGKDMSAMIKGLIRDAVDVYASSSTSSIIGYVGAAVNWNVLRREAGGFFGVFYPTENGLFGERDGRGNQKRGGDDEDDGPETFMAYLTHIYKN